MTNESPPFITALKNGGTKEEAIFALERMWEEQCGLRAEIEKLRGVPLPHVETPPFITALKNGGTKEEAIFALERMWEEQCGQRSALEELESAVAPTMKAEERLSQSLGYALLRARRFLASLDGRS